MTRIYNQGFLLLKEADWTALCPVSIDSDSASSGVSSSGHREFCTMMCLPVTCGAERNQVIAGLAPQFLPRNLLVDSVKDGLL